jgi:hypothetical protein
VQLFSREISINKLAPHRKTRVRIHGWAQRLKKFAFLLLLGTVLDSDRCDLTEVIDVFVRGSDNGLSFKRLGRENASAGLRYNNWGARIQSSSRIRVKIVKNRSAKLR